MAVKLDADRALDFPYAKGAHIMHVVTMAVKLDAERALDVIPVSIQCMSASILR